VVHAYGNHVLSFSIEIRGHIVHERNVSVGTLSKKMTVEIHAAAVIYAFEIDIGLRRIYSLAIKALAISCDTSREVTGTAGKIRRERTLYRPIMRKGKLLPLAVVKFRLGSILVIAMLESP